MSHSVIVLGAGIIGVSTALQLQKRGHQVVLVDRRGAGEETSYGNAGLIQREGVVPYGFPQELGLLMRYGLNNNIDAHYQMSALPRVAKFLGQYWWHSNARRHEVIARSYAPLIENSVSEHAGLIEEAGAQGLIRKDGWTEAFRTKGKMDAEVKEAERLAQEYGISYKVLDAAGLQAAEPHLSTEFIGALHWNDPWSVLDPKGLTISYLRLFERLGGRFVNGDGMTAAPSASGKGWQVRTSEGVVEAEQAVVAMGPWSEDFTAKLGYRFVMGVKRGYHMHYGAKGNATLNNWTMDKERGYFLAPMNQGIRLTTGAQFALRDAPKHPVQLDRAEKVARSIFPLGERLDAEPWMGSRPCTPDMMPVIGKAPRHNGLWFAFGHAHHGLTLGPVTGTLIADAMEGKTPLIDISPYRPERFSA